MYICPNADYESRYKILLSSLSDFLHDDTIVVLHQQNPILRLIAALPFIAGCSQPERVALVHMSTYLLMAQPGLPKQVFLHNTTDNQSLFTRLALLNTFPDGKPDVIKRGMNILALVMIQDHMHDMENDKQKNKYNPVEAGIWEFESLRQSLIHQISQTTCPDMEAIFPLQAVLKQDWWGIP